jgi:hypothetical protein
MSRLEQLLFGALVLVGLLLAGWLGVRHYGAEQHQAGHAAAVAEGEVQRARAAKANRQIESDLRAQLHAKDADALKKEQNYAASLETAQRRLRAGTDRLRCPVGTVPDAAEADNRSAAAGPRADGEGSAIVPEAAAEILSDASDVAGLVRRYDRVVERFEACRAVNAK